MGVIFTTKAHYSNLDYIIKIGRFVCGQRCDWSARSAGLACAQRRPYARAGPARPARMRGQGTLAARASHCVQAENERSEFSACK